MAPSLPQPSFCSNLFPNGDNDEERYSDMETSAQQFLEKLSLPRIHPHCVEGYQYPSHLAHQLTDPFPPPEVSAQSSSFLSHIISGAFRILPLVVAMAELLSRFFAFAIAPIAITYLLSEAVQPVGSSTFSKFRPSTTNRLAIVDVLACLLGVASSLVLLTDSLYVMEFGRAMGWSLWVASSALALHACVTRPRLLPHRNRVLAVLAALWMITVHLLLHSEDTDTSRGIDLPIYKEGFYVSPRANPLIHRLVAAWPESRRTYDVEHGATPWLVTGDSRTAIPFVLDGGPEFGSDYYKRVFVSNPIDEEAVALDIAFPTTNQKGLMTHDDSKPLYVLLHPLNDDSDANYVRSVVASLNAEQSTVMVMVARGSMDLPIRGWNVFSGARISDIAAVARAIRKSGVVAPKQVFAGIGLSMGGIILSNYVAQSGKACDLDVAIAVSGALDTRENFDNHRSQRVWQPLVAKTLRDRFLRKFDARFRHRLGEELYRKMLFATNLKELDDVTAVAFFGYQNITHYHSEVSPMGDQSVFRTRRHSDDNNHVGRIANVEIPLCILSALDDPIISWRAAAGRDPQSLVSSGKGNLMLLLTKSGGHVGWPIGMIPVGWGWMNMVIRDYVWAYAQASGKKGRVQ